MATRRPKTTKPAPARRPAAAAAARTPARRVPAAFAADADASPHTVSVNRAPVLALWAAVVAERLGHDRDAALTLGRAVSGLNAQRKGRRLGIFGPPESGVPERRRVAREAKGAFTIELLGREVPAMRTPDGVRALEDARPADPESVRRYLEARFGEAFQPARAAFEALARALPKEELAERAFELYERFRPAVPAGRRGWGAKGVLDLERVRGLARER
jgi:hypothetical protein